MTDERFFRLRAICILSALLSFSVLAMCSYARNPESTFQVHVSPGWNLLSLPARVDSASLRTLFPTAISPAFMFNPDVGYEPQDSLPCGFGFWLKFRSCDTVEVQGIAKYTDTIEVVAGWNIIGGLSVPLPVACIQTNPGDLIVSQFFGYLPGTGLQAADTLLPGQGYWVKSGQTGLFVLSDPKSTIATTTVNSNEIGGAGVRLVSCFEDGGIGTGDTLAVRVSREGNQLLLAFDGLDSLRALTLSSPQDGEARVLSVDAQNTALALVFMSPGISTTDSSQFQTTISDIASLPSFALLEDFLVQRLYSMPLSQAIGDSLCDSLLADCLLEFASLHPVRFGQAQFEAVREERNHFELVHTEYPNGHVYLQMRNKSWRYANVVRRDLAYNGTWLGNTTLVDQMGGAIPYSWGCIFTWSCFDPTDAEDDFYFSSDVGSSDLWVISTGWPPSSDVPPPDIQAMEAPWLPSIFHYVALPFIDLFTGASSFIHQAPDWVISTTLAIKIARPGITADHLRDATTTTARRREGINLTSQMASSGQCRAVVGFGNYSALRCQPCALGTCLDNRRSLHEVSPYST
jgi:hypothetical protein